MFATGPQAGRGQCSSEIIGCNLAAHRVQIGYDVPRTVDMPSLHGEPLTPAGSHLKDAGALGHVEPLAPDEEVLQGRYGTCSTPSSIVLSDRIGTAVSGTTCRPGPRAYSR